MSLMKSLRENATIICLSTGLVGFAGLAKGVHDGNLKEIVTGGSIAVAAGGAWVAAGNKKEGTSVNYLEMASEQKDGLSWIDREVREEAYNNLPKNDARRNRMRPGGPAKV